MPYDFSGKRVAVVGLARSGKAAALVLATRGANVTIYESKATVDMVADLKWASEHGIRVVGSADSVQASDLAIVSPGVRQDSPIMHSILAQEIKLWGEIELAYQIAKAPILAVTGTNGKTTTVLMLAEMTRSGGKRTFAAGNIAAGSLAQPLTVAADLAGPDDVIVAEISSFQLETIKTFRPKAASILNITPDHMDRQNWGEYVQSKWRIFENQGNDDTAVLGSSVPFIGNKPHLPNDVRYFDTMARPDWIGDLLLPGEHNRLNAMAAYAMASSIGIQEDAIRKAALSFKGVVHRLEFVDRINGITYINNSMCTNNAAFASSLSALAGKKIVLSGGVFKGGDMSQIADAVAKSNVKVLAAFGRSGPQIAEVVRSRTDVRTAVFETMDEAVSFASTDAASGEIVVLNPGCASFDQFKDFEDRGEKFKLIVSSLRKAAGA